LKLLSLYYYKLKGFVEANQTNIAGIVLVGSLVVVVGFLLRLVTLILYKNREKEQVLLLDETFSHVSEVYLEPLSEMLRMISHKLGVQIILVSHQDTLTSSADKVYEVSKVKGRAVVKER